MRKSIVFICVCFCLISSIDTKGDCYIDVDSIEVSIGEGENNDDYNRDTNISDKCVLNQKVIIRQEEASFWSSSFFWGLISGALASLVATVLFNILCRTWVTCGDVIAKDDSEQDYKNIAFMVRNNGLLGILNVNVDASFYYVDKQGKLFTQPIFLFKDHVAYLGGIFGDKEDNYHCFVSLNYKRFNKDLKEYQNLLIQQSIKEAGIQVIVTSTHNLSGIVSKEKKQYSFDDIKKGRYVQREFMQA